MHPAIKENTEKTQETFIFPAGVRTSVRVLDSLKILLQQPKAAHKVHALFDHESFTLTCYISGLIYAKPPWGQKYLHFFYMPPFSLNNTK